MKPNRFLFNNFFGLDFLFRTLRYRNFRLFFVGQGISLIGSWMQVIALSWLVYRLTNSAFLLGAVGFTSQIPTFIFAPFAGVLADRLNRRRILVITQTLAMFQALVLAILTLAGAITVRQIIFLSIFSGLINAFDIPTRQTFLVDMVENKDDLLNAVALNSSMFNAARLIGPSLAGILIAVAGEGICFLVNSISFLAVIFALMAMKIKSLKVQNQNTNILQELKEGFIYAFSFAAVRYILLIVALVSLMGMSYVVLMPIFAKDILGGGPSTLGLLMGVAGLGALVGAIFLASRKNIDGLKEIINLATIVFGASLIFFSFSRILWLSLLLILFVGCGLMVQLGASNTVLQVIVDDDKRGRIMSFYAMSFMGMAPFGSLLAGGLASKAGAPYTLLISGLFCILGSVFLTNKLSFLKASSYFKKSSL